jgi:hypothetical protein
VADQTPAAPGAGLLERDVELQAAERALDTLAAGPGGGLLVYTGAAGLGKTSLLARVCEAAAARKLLVLSARGGEQEQLSAFHVVRSLLLPLLRAVGEAEQRELLGGTRSWRSRWGWPTAATCRRHHRTRRACATAWTGW